jgi:glutaminase
MTALTRAVAGFAVAVAVAAGTTRVVPAQAGADVQKAVDAAYAKFKDLKDGKNADYIPALANVDPNLFGIAVVTSFGFHTDAAGRNLSVLQDVYESESDTNQRNQAIGALMLAYGYIKTNWQQAVDLYTRQCSIGVNARDLAMMASTLAFGGRNPVTGKQVLNAAKVPGVPAVMATAGLYDDSGKWLYHTGLPAKSGVGGGIIAVSPGKFGIAVVSPPLDDAGNSVRAQRAIADISNALQGNPFAVPQ